MRRITVFDSISLDGYFTDAKSDMSFAHKTDNDPEWARFSAQNAGRGNGSLLMGRKTYELMVSFWPTDKAKQQMPEVAEGMNRLEKLVVSRSLKHSDWNNTKIIAGDLANEVKKLKAGSGDPVVILGSGTIVAQLTKERLVDEYTFVVVPVVLGAGRTLFEGVEGALELKRTSEKAFDNGNVVVTYEPKT